MANKSAKNPCGAGRKLVPIDWEKVDNSLKQFLDGTEVAAELGISEDTLYRRCKEEHHMDFAAYRAIKRSAGAGILKKAQFRSAIGHIEKGVVILPPNPTMQIWLGKQHLDQKERTDVTSGDKEIKSVPSIVVTSDGVKDALEAYMRGDQPQIKPEVGQEGAAAK